MAEKRVFKVARKHISWYTKGLAGSASFRHHMNQLETCEEQLDAVNRFFEQFGPRESAPALRGGAGGMRQTNEIADCVRRSLERYFKDLDGAKPRAIYDMVHELQHRTFGRSEHHVIDGARLCPVEVLEVPLQRPADAVADLVCLPHAASSTSLAQRQILAPELLRRND